MAHPLTKYRLPREPVYAFPLPKRTVGVRSLIEMFSSLLFGRPKTLLRAIHALSKLYHTSPIFQTLTRAPLAVGKGID